MTREKAAQLGAPSLLGQANLERWPGWMVKIDSRTARPSPKIDPSEASI
jgi:hypothetical protein